MNIKFFASLLLAISFSACSSEQVNGEGAALAAKFQGGWEAVKWGGRADAPYSVFNVELDVNGRVIKGRYCFVTHYGDKSDCDPEINNITGTFNPKNGVVNIAMVSSFDAAGGQAELRMSGETLQWTLIKQPIGGEFYIPKKSLMSRASVPSKSATSK